MTDVAFPYRFDGTGRTAAAALDEHVRELIEQVLFTAPGERVNRPTFGSGLLQLVFAGSSDELTTTTEFLVQGALQQWLGGIVRIESLDVQRDDAELLVTIGYRLQDTEDLRTAVVVRELP